MSFYKRILSHSSNLAINSNMTYKQLLSHSTVLSSQLQPLLTSHKRVAYLLERDPAYPICQIATWQAQACAIPLSTQSTRSELEYVLSDSAPEVVVCDPKYYDLVSGLRPSVIPYEYKED